MDNVVGLDVARIFCERDRLEHTLRAHRHRVSIVLEHIAEYHVLDTFLVILLGHIYADMLSDAQTLGLGFDAVELFLGKTAGIDDHRMDLEILFGRIKFSTIRGI